MKTSKLMRTVERRTTQEMAFPDQALNRSMRSRNLCNSPLYDIERGPGRPGPREDRSKYRLVPDYTFGRLSKDSWSGSLRLMVSAHGKTRSAHAFCDFRIATKSGLSFDSPAMTLSHAASWLSRTDCGVFMNLMLWARSLAWSSEFLAIWIHSPSADAACID